MEEGYQKHPPIILTETLDWDWWFPCLSIPTKIYCKLNSELDYYQKVYLEYYSKGDYDMARYYQGKFRAIADIFPHICNSYYGKMCALTKDEWNHYDI